VTTEQTIVLGVLAAAFVAGWGVRALIGRAERRAASPDVEPPRDERPRDERLDPALEESRQELEKAMVSYVRTLAASTGVLPPGGESRPLVDEVSAALQDDAANESMIRGVDGNGLSERELDLADWGFAYGVAWSRVRERRPGDPGDTVARDARRAAESVFRDYAAEAGWRKRAESEPTENGDEPPPQD
jgi:hypothetical protein